ncbi:MAG TPA: sugar ABC transporter substrate-binding protein [Lachnospiraceae bacterium]
MTKKWYKQKGALAVAMLVAATTVLSGCGGQAKEKKEDSKQKEKASAENFNAEGLPILKEKETFVIAVPQKSTLKAAGEKACVLEAEKATNVHIEWVEIPESGWDEKINIMFSTDSLPDAIIGDIDMARNFEQLAALDEYLDKYAPAVTKFFESREDYPNALKAPDETIRTLPIGDESIHNTIDSQIWINQKWLDALSLKMPTNTEELKEVLVAFRDKDPNGNGQKDEIPFTFKKSWGWGTSIENFFGNFGVVENEAHVFQKDGKVVFSGAEQGYYDALAYLNDLYKDGLVDKEVFTMSDDQYAARGSVGDTLGMVAGYVAGEAGVLNEEDYRVLPVLKHNGMAGIVGLNNVTKNGGFAISKSCKNPAALVRWYDYINSSLESSLNWGRGAKGVAWNIVEKDGQEIAQILTMDEKVLEENGGYKSKSEYRTSESFAGITPSLWRFEYDEKRIYDDKAPYDYKMEAVKSQIESGVKGLPAGTASLENAEKRSILQADIDTYLEKFISDSVLNGIDESKWEGHKKTLESLKVDEYTKLCQEYTDSIK